MAKTKAEQEYQEQVQREHDRLMEIFQGAQESKLSLLDGHIWENARIRVELDRLSGIAASCGLVKVSKTNPLNQRETAVSKMLTKLRASYNNSSRLLSKELLGLEPEEEDDLEEFQ